MMRLNPAAAVFVPVDNTGSDFMAKLDALNALSLDDLCLEVGISEAQLSELEEAESWVDTQAMLAEMQEQEELLHMVSH